MLQYWPLDLTSTYLYTQSVYDWKKLKVLPSFQNFSGVHFYQIERNYTSLNHADYI